MFADLCCIDTRVKTRKSKNHYLPTRMFPPCLRMLYIPEDLTLIWVPRLVSVALRLLCEAPTFFRMGFAIYAIGAGQLLRCCSTAIPGRALF